MDASSTAQHSMSGTALDIVDDGRTQVLALGRGRVELGYKAHPERAPFYECRTGLLFGRCFRRGRGRRRNGFFQCRRTEPQRSLLSFVGGDPGDGNASEQKVSECFGKALQVLGFLAMASRDQGRRRFLGLLVFVLVVAVGVSGSISLRGRTVGLRGGMPGPGPVPVVVVVVRIGLEIGANQPAALGQDRQRGPLVCQLNGMQECVEVFRLGRSRHNLSRENIPCRDRLVVVAGVFVGPGVGFRAGEHAASFQGHAQIEALRFGIGHNGCQSTGGSSLQGRGGIGGQGRAVSDASVSL
mmetsp:Transcript_18380/g.40026  ORF Transcript_18380/g.40026 Transcript_18380/m.40026 type:complete len:298 (+) Transcript_18380:1967-2860(+)